jgi:hypothetical protein
VCHFACSCLVFFLFFDHYLGGCTCGDIPLAILGFDHIFSWGALHLVGTLHIHPCSWLLWDSHMWCGPFAIFGVVVMEHSPRRIILLFLSLMHLRGHT